MADFGVFYFLENIFVMYLTFSLDKSLCLQIIAATITFKKPYRQILEKPKSPHLTNSKKNSPKSSSILQVYLRLKWNNTLFQLAKTKR